MTVKACEVCGSAFTVKAKGPRRFCSKTCADSGLRAQRSSRMADMSHQQVGESNPAFVHGGWAGIKPARRIADKSACAHCGATDVRIDAHHIDHDHSNNDPSNLIALCAPCHSKVHGLERRQLTDEQVREIRSLAEHMTPAAIHRTGRFPVGRSTIYNVLNGVACGDVR